MRPIFEEYDASQQSTDDPNADGGVASSSSASDKPSAGERAKTFATELEGCMMEKYAELDPKTGRMAPLNKYKYASHFCFCFSSNLYSLAMPENACGCSHSICQRPTEYC